MIAWRTALADKLCSAARFTFALSSAPMNVWSDMVSPSRAANNIIRIIAIIEHGAPCDERASRTRGQPAAAISKTITRQGALATPPSIVVFTNGWSQNDQLTIERFTILDMAPAGKTQKRGKAHHDQ